MIVGVLALMVIGLTAYGLVVPAITMEAQLGDGFSEHVHVEECYSAEGEIICGLEENISGETGGGLEEAIHEDAGEEVATAAYISETYGAAKAAADSSYTKVDFDKLIADGTQKYVVYTRVDNAYYAVTGSGTVKSITVSNGKITSSVTDDLLWTFEDHGSGTYMIQNVSTDKYMHSYKNSNSDYGIITSGAYTSNIETTGQGSDKTFRVKSNRNYSRIYRSNSSIRVATTTNSSEASHYYIAAVSNASYTKTCHVWLDGTNGGLMNLYESESRYQAVTAGSQFALPETWKSPSKYPYKLNGWYNIEEGTYHEPGETVTINDNAVFYADWIAATYDVGQNNSHVVDSMDTDSFITTHVFDYSVLFNVQSLTHTGTITASKHDETWNIANSGTVEYKKKNKETGVYEDSEKTLAFVFLDYDSNGDFSYANGRTKGLNVNDSVITKGIIPAVNKASGGKNIIDILFDPSLEVIGKEYIGTGNYLYQYMERGMDNYDGSHNGYYYFDSKKNAASYNQKDQRFYLYDYLERTSDAQKDGGEGEYSDFLPFNSTYILDLLDTEKTVRTYTYTDPQGNVLNGYTFDAKSNKTNENSYAQYAGTNYFFGMSSEIEFFLPNKPGEKDSEGNYGNQSAKGQDMIFEFHGDDDVWVFLDDVLVLDIGGVHGIEHGKIDFSTGKIELSDQQQVNPDNLNITAASTELDLNKYFSGGVNAGEHTLTIYYMERGSSQSNCSIYFNLAPFYDLDIAKTDNNTGELLEGTEFTVYSDAECTQPAQLWASMAEWETGKPASGTFAVKNGVVECWGITAGKTYYIKETKPVAGYPASDDVIILTLNNKGVSSVYTEKTAGPDGEKTPGYEVISQDVSDTAKVVLLGITNEKKEEVYYSLPYAGGMGTTPITLAGIGLIILAAAGLFLRRRFS